MLYQKGQVSVKVIDFGSSCYEHQKGKAVPIPLSEFLHCDSFLSSNKQFPHEVSWVLLWAQPSQLLV